MKANAATLLAVLLMSASIGHAQRDLLGVDEVAEAFVMMTTPTWRGPRVPVPQERLRPNGDRLGESPFVPVVVHGGASTSRERVQRMMEALEHAHRTLDAEGWPVWMTDGSVGGGSEWDVYLAPAEASAVAYSDGPALWSYRDRASTFAVVDASIPNDALGPCATDAFVRAMLLAYDPAEARSWREATAAWLTWRLTGVFGCQDAGADAARNAATGWVSQERGGAGGVMLAMLSSQHDDGDGSFVRGLWALASQRTWEGDALRADPDLWAALKVLLEVSGGALEQTVADMAVARYFAGLPSAFSDVTRSLEGPISPTRTLKKLPSKMVSSVTLHTLGSAYVLSAPLSGLETLRVWLRGEFGVRWSLVLVQLDERGLEIGRLVAPPTTQVKTQAYLPAKLDPDAKRVLAVVTNLSSRRPDADEADANGRRFELTIAP